MLQYKAIFVNCVVSQWRYLLASNWHHLVNPSGLSHSSLEHCVLIDELLNRLWNLKSFFVIEIHHLPYSIKVICSQDYFFRGCSHYIHRNSLHKIVAIHPSSNWQKSAMMFVIGYGWINCTCAARHWTISVALYLLCFALYQKIHLKSRQTCMLQGYGVKSKTLSHNDWLRHKVW